MGGARLFSAPCSALWGPRGTPKERLHSPWRGLLPPDMMCLTKAGKEDGNQPLHLAPLSPLNLFSLLYTA